MLPKVLSEIIRSAFPEAEFELRDLVGDNNHYELSITSANFIGLSRIARHRMVYAALDEYVKSGELHAISIKTHTP